MFLLVFGDIVELTENVCVFKVPSFIGNLSSAIYMDVSLSFIYIL